MNKTAVTIIVSVYNVEQYLKECLDSIKNQSFTLPYQVILVDTNSSDNSGNIAKEYASKYSNFYYYRFEINRGVSFTRNIGISLAIGEYLSFVDGDDLLSPDFLSILYKKAKDTSADIVTGGYFMYGKKTKKGYSRTSYKGNGNHVLKKLYKSLFMKYRTFCWGRLYKRSLLNENKILFSTELRSYEDFLFINEVMIHSEKVVFLKECLYYYRQRQGSIMSVSKGRTENHLKAILLSEKYISKENKKLHDKIFTYPSLAMKLQISFDAKLEKEDKKSYIKKLKDIYRSSK